MAEEIEEQEHEEETPGGGDSDVVTINPQIFEAADTLPKTVSDDEKAYFVAAADWFTRELITNLAEAYPEILRIADKNGDNGQKSKTSNIAVALKMDVTNLQLLTLGLNLSVNPWKLNLKAEAEEDLRQLHLNFATRSATKVQTPDTGEPHETTPRGGDDAPQGDLFGGGGDDQQTIPAGVPIPDKPGFVRSPFVPEEEPSEVDVRGFAPGQEVRCPSTNKVFIVPGEAGAAPTPTPEPPVEKAERKRYTREQLEALAADGGKNSLESVLSELVSSGAELKFAKRDTLAQMVQKLVDAQDVLNQRDDAATE